MHYLIFGAGAVGSYVGGRLALSGQKTTFLTRPGKKRTFQKNGLRIVDKTDDELLPNPILVDSVQQAFSPSPPEVILLTVKTYDIEIAAAQILDCAPAPLPILCLTNGVGSEALLSEFLTDFPIIPVTLTTAVQLAQDGVVHIERERGMGIAGTHPLIDRLVIDFTQSNISMRRYQDGKRMKWSKLLTNIVSNASSAILGWSPTRIFQHPKLYRIEVEALRETVRLMRKIGVKPQNLPGVPVALLSSGIFLPPWMTQRILSRIVSRGRGEKLPSFHYDIGRGRSEIIHLNGAVVKEGMRVGLPTPANRFLTDTMLAIVNDANQHKDLRNHPEEFLNRAYKTGVPGIQGYNP
jgi:2-dehydropantoate 2-reductase